MNVLAKLMDLLVRHAEELSPETIRFWLRLLCLLTIPAAACAWTFKQGYRSAFLQIAAGVLGALAALSLPLQQVQIWSGVGRLWLLTIVLLLMFFTPLILPNLLVPTLGAQQRLRKAFIAVLVALLLSNLIWG